MASGSKFPFCVVSNLLFISQLDIGGHSRGGCNYNRASAKSLHILYRRILQNVLRFFAEGLSSPPPVGFFPGFCFLHQLDGVFRGGLSILGAGNHNSEFRNP